jgi:hypothetical protein
LYSRQWEKAIPVELEQLKSMKTFEWVPKVPEGCTAIGSKIVFREKRDGHRNIIKHKARIVAKGYSQIPGQDFDLTFSPYAPLAVVAREDWELHQVDIVGAYPQGNLDEEIYMPVPEGMNVKGREGWYRKLLNFGAIWT